MQKISKSYSKITIYLYTVSVFSMFIFNDELEDYIAKIKNGGTSSNHSQLVDPLFERTQSELAKSMNEKLLEISNMMQRIQNKKRESNAAIKQEYNAAINTKDFGLLNRNASPEFTSIAKIDDTIERPYAKFFDKTSSIEPFQNSSEVGIATKNKFLDNETVTSKINSFSDNQPLKSQNFNGENNSFQSKLSSFKDLLGESDIKKDINITYSQNDNFLKKHHEMKHEIISIDEYKNLLNEIDDLPQYITNSGTNLDKNLYNQSATSSSIHDTNSIGYSTEANPLNLAKKAVICYKSAFYDEIRKLDANCKFDSQILKYYTSPIEFFTQMTILIRNHSDFYNNLPIQNKVTILRCCIKVFFLLVSDYEMFELEGKNFYDDLASPLFSLFCHDECFGSNEKDRNTFFNMLFNQIGKEALRTEVSRVDVIRVLSLCSKLFKCNFNYIPSLE